MQDEAKYLVFDGDVDAVWVENMNSVMDDNRLLTLPNGERIRLQSHCRLLFEVFSLVVSQWYHHDIRAMAMSTAEFSWWVCACTLHCLAAATHAC